MPIHSLLKTLLYSLTYFQSFFFHNTIFFKSLTSLVSFSSLIASMVVVEEEFNCSTSHFNNSFSSDKSLFFLESDEHSFSNTLFFCKAFARPHAILCRHEVNHHRKASGHYLDFFILVVLHGLFNCLFSRRQFALICHCFL